MSSTMLRFTVLTLSLCLAASPALAAVSSGNILSNVTDQFRSQASSWGAIITGYATWLFWTLGMISLVWTGGTLILKKADIGEFFAEFIRFILFFGFFLWLLRNAADIGAAIIHSMMMIGSTASRTVIADPSAIMDIGFQIFHTVMEQTTILSPTDSIVGALLAIIILICIALIAANMTILLCSAWILLYAGIFFLGFGGSRWTSDIAINYYKTLFSIAVSLMVMILMIGIAQSIITTYYQQMGPGIEVTGIATVMLVALILLLLVHRVPGLITGIISGSSVGHGGIGSMGAGTALGAAGVAALTGGAIAASAARNIGGAGQAMVASYKSAQQSMASQNANPQQSSTMSGGLAEAMGSKSFAGEMAKSLAGGMSGAMKQSAASMNSATKDTFFGKVASHIQSDMATKESMPNSMGGADEVADFVNKSKTT
jgi:type IV secretion system protein TrbL